MTYVIYTTGRIIDTVYNEQEARKLAIEFDNENPADIHIKNDNGSHNGYIILVPRLDKNGVEHWV